MFGLSVYSVVWEQLYGIGMHAVDTITVYSDANIEHSNEGVAAAW